MSPSLMSAAMAMAVFFSSALGELPLPIDLGYAKPYAIMAGSTVTSTGVVGTIVNGNIGLYPGTAVTGFPPALLYGAVDTANTNSFNAQGSLTAAYNIAAGLPYNTSLSSMDLGGMILGPNVYNFAGAAAMNGVLTLDANGDANAVWVFQIASSLLIAQGSSILFKDSIGNPDYVYWQVGSSATLGPNVPMIGNIMAFASITVNGGATVNGRCLARNAAVSLDNCVITKPSTVSFSAMQTVTGISLAQYNNDPSLNSATLMETIAQTMTGVLPSNINNFEVTTGPTSSPAATQKVTAAARILFFSTITMRYEVVAASSVSSTVLQGLLTSAVNSGAFSTYLAAAASANDAMDLLSATSGMVQTETTSDDSTNDNIEIMPNSGGSTTSSSDQSSLSAGAIAGIVIGAAIGLVLFAMLAYFFLFKEASAGTNKSSAVEINEV